MSVTEWPVQPRLQNAALVDELGRQFETVWRERTLRILAGAIAYATSAIFLPGWLVTICFLGNLASEFIAMALLNGLDPERQPTRYRLAVAMTFPVELFFTLPAAFMWQSEDPNARAFSVAMMVAAMIHLATVRAIHLPIGLFGFAALILSTFGTNTIYWSARGDWLGLTVSSICAAGAIGYGLSAMVSNNLLHRSSAQSREAANAANEAKTRFLSQMSHELRTPLNAILGMGHAELARHPDALSQERLHLLIEAAGGLNILLDDILDMSAVQEGRMPIRPEPVYLTAVISDAVALFRPQVESAGIAMTLELSPELPPVARMDAQRLRQCLSNILSNALKHTGTGSIWIRAGMNPSGQLSICVADTGTGVPDALVERLFEPFHRGPGSHPGTGLGLAISRTLARRMGGDLELVASATGAHFCLTLAIGRATPDDLTAAKHAETGSQSLAGKRFLVVDDIATNRLVAATYLRMMGAEVDEASSGAAALAQIEARPPSLVLLDINMPDLDGVATLHRMRLLGGVAEQIPVVAMTADATEAHRLHYLAAGLDGYVAKPLTPERLAAAIRPHLGEPAAGHDPSSPEVIA